MEQEETIEILENLERGNFLTVNIPLVNDEKMPITVMYMGKDREGRYNFIDTGRFIMSKEFIKQKSISVDKNFDEEKAREIHAKVRMQIDRKLKKGMER